MSKMLEGRMSGALKVGLVVATLLATVSLGGGIWNAVQPTGSQDFQWGPSRALLQHKDPYALKLGEYKHPDLPEPYIFSQDPSYPVSGYVFLWPYAAMPWPAARLMWALSNVGFMILLVWGLGWLFLRTEPKWIWWLAGCVFAMGTPLRNLIGNGQQVLFSLSFFVLALCCLKREKPIWSGVCLALALFKFTVTVPLLIFFLVGRNYRPLLVAASIHLALSLFASVWVHTPPLQLLREYAQVALTESHQGVDGYVDINAVLNHLGLSGVPLLWQMLSLLLMLAVAYVVFRYGTRQEFLCLALLGLLSSVVVYHRTYDMIVLIFALFYVLGQNRDQLREPAVVLLGLCLLLIWFVEKPIFLLQTRSDSPLVHGFIDVYQCVVMALVYTTLIYGFMVLYLRNQQAPAPVPR